MAGLPSTRRFIEPVPELWMSKVSPLAELRSIPDVESTASVPAVGLETIIALAFSSVHAAHFTMSLFGTIGPPLSWHAPASVVYPPFPALLIVAVAAVIFELFNV